MAADFRIKVDLRKLEKKYSETGIRRAIRAAGKAVGREWRRTTIEKHLSGSGNAGLARRTGRLAQSTTYEASDFGVQVGFGVGYWRIHEFGGTIRGNPYLTIPLDGVKTRAGVTKETFTVAANRPGTFIVQSKSNPHNKVLLQRIGQTVVPLYVLAREVVIPARTDHLGVFRDLAPGVFRRSLLRSLT